jgi:predicted DNA-binding transcriptional regulator YafY
MPSAKKQRPQNFRPTIRDASESAERLRIRYASKKAGGRIISREVRPEEVRGRYLWGSDNIHGVNKVHSFRLDRIVSVEPTGKGFQKFDEREQ